MTISAFLILKVNIVIGILTTIGVVGLMGAFIALIAEETELSIKLLVVGAVLIITAMLLPTANDIAIISDNQRLYDQIHSPAIE